MLQGLSARLQEASVKYNNIKYRSRNTDLEQFVGKKVHARRTELGLSCCEFADMLHITETILVNYEVGARRVRPELLVEMANALGVRLWYFFRDDVDEVQRHVADGEAESLRRHK